MAKDNGSGPPIYCVFTLSSTHKAKNNGHSIDPFLRCVFLFHTGTYFTHEAKGADDAADADTAIINAEGGHSNSDTKKEYYI